MKYDEAIRMIRKASVMVSKFFRVVMGGSRKSQMNDALTALDSLAESKPLDPTMQAVVQENFWELAGKPKAVEQGGESREFANIMANHFNDSDNPYKQEWVAEAADLIIAHDERIRRECADRGVEWYTQVFCIPNNEERVEKLTRGLRNYIMGEAKK